MSHGTFDTMTSDIWLASLGRTQRPLLASILLLRVLQLLSQISALWWFSKAMEVMIVDAQPAPTSWLAWLMLSMISWILTAQFSQSLRLRCQTKYETDLETQIHHHWRQSQVALVRKYSPFFWQNLILDQIPAVALYLSQYQVQKWLSALAPVVVLSVLFPVNGWVAALLLLTMPMVPLFMILVGKGAAELQRKHFVALNRLGQLFTDRIKALTLLTATNQHGPQQQVLSQASEGLNQRTMKVVSVAFLSSSVLDFFSTLSMALVAVFIGFNILGEVRFDAQLGFQEGLFILLVAPALFAELKTLGRFYHQKAQAVSAAQALFPVLQSRANPAEHHEFSGLSWLNFHMDEPHLHARQLHLKPGEWVQLHGASGAGKTVFLEALMGFRAASHRLSDDCALLSQDAVILQGSLRDNLKLDKARDDEQLWHALQQVQLDQWAKALPEQLDTEMGQYPALSGGERHRLSLARVLLQDASVVLLDEPTAHLTNEQHQQIIAMMRMHLHSKTVIWASHRALPSDWFGQHWTIQDSEVICQ